MLKLVAMEVSDHAVARPVSADRVPWIIAIVALGAGLAIRYALRGYTNVDAGLYLIPWYAYARDHGALALGDAFTNYTPFFSYLLLISTAFDGLAAPLTIVKAISAAFELACALMVARMVWGVTQSQMRAAGAFAAVWLAPMTLFNGAAWGQADSIWSFFILASIWLFMTARNGSVPIAVAVAVKLQAIFLGPFVLGMLMRRRFMPLWLAAIPVAYLLLAVPVLLAGRDLGGVLTIYLDQANTFHRLSVNAANLWWPVRSSVPYGIGSLVGVGLGAGAGGILAIVIRHAKRDDPEWVLQAACTSLLVMPFLLPMMHERYFYAYELATIPLAFINPRLAPFAIVAQVTGVCAYLAFDRGITEGLLPAALANGVAAVILWILLTGRRPAARRSL